MLVLFGLICRNRNWNRTQNPILTKKEQEFENILKPNKKKNGSEKTLNKFTNYQERNKKWNGAEKEQKAQCHLWQTLQTLPI